MPAKKGKKQWLKKRKQTLSRQQLSNIFTEHALVSTEEDASSQDRNLLTGDFPSDFATLCKHRGVQYVPAVTGRRLLPDDNAAAASLPRLPKKLSRHKKSVAVEPTNKSLSPLSVDVSFSDKTNLKTPLSYFKPRVQVEFTKWGKGVKEMYIEGWKVDNTMVSILCDCCLFLDDLVHLQLWNVGLSPLALCTLASVLPRFQCLNSLILDANPLGDANVAPLIDPDNSKLETLSLRFCQLGDINAQALGRALGTTNKWNSKLLTLNLSNNRITDEGVRHLARGLMTNRTLLVLNLAANDIGDDGAAALAQVLSYFALDHQQLLARRQKLAAQIPALPNDLSPYLGLTTRRQRLSPTVSLTHSSRLSLAQRTPSPIDLKQHGLRSPYYGIERRASAESIISQTRRKKNGKWSSRCQKLMMTMAQLRTASKISSEIDLSGHPLLEVVTRHGGHQRFCMVGNRSLFSLNLARNAIGERGLASLWEMVQDQVVAPKGQVQKTPGLKRLVVHRNAVPADNKVLLQLQHYMRLRDPLHKSPLISLNRNNIPPCAMPPIYV